MTREAAIKILMGGELNPCVAEDREACDMAVKALEQEPKSEWEQDHAILKAYSDGANEVLDKIRAEIESKYNNCDICEFVEDYDYEENDISEYRPIGDIADILEIIDKYKGENEG